MDNPYFPLKPGTAFHYRGVRDGTAQTDDMVVTSQTKFVLGVRCTVVRDTVSEHGKPLEQQTGWEGHAAFMDELVERGFIVLGGPLGDE